MGVQMVARPLAASSGVVVRACQVPSSTYVGSPNIGCVASYFSTNSALRAPSRKKPDLEGVPIIENPPPDVVLLLLEGRAATCAGELSQRVIFGRNPTPELYYRGIVTNIRLMSHYMNTVDRDEFRSSTVEDGSPIARGRKAYITFARVADRWMNEAFSILPPGPVDPELADTLYYFRMNSQLIDLYEQGDKIPPPRPAWTDICDAIVLASHVAHDPLDGAAGGVPWNEALYDVTVTPREPDERK
ncbi:hypothetical protein SCP_0202480 [Sparassis crispa]|uniref:Uncharacterized protein n=1 Tax=Sparassis crispa TaxID=139825 RepID=A0A401GA69_9APHY|nr:hypothetical protein SCP_0202480 [Sparassis crispa]GBE79051.1 hypothetical protein SCP_0202480 [Sparassis crispa]